MHFRFRNSRKKLIIFLDMFITAIVFLVLSYLVSFNNGGKEIGFVNILPHLILMFVCGRISHYMFNTYKSIWRYAECKEYMTLLLSGVMGYFMFLLIDDIVLGKQFPLLFSMAGYSTSILCMLMMRFAYQIYRKRNTQRGASSGLPLAIIGAGSAGVTLLDEIQADPNSGYRVCLFIDDSYEKIGKRIHNIEVKGPISDLPKLLAGTGVSELILALPSIDHEKKKEILELCATMKCHVRILPDRLSLIQNDHDKSLSNSIREIKVEDLLGREPVSLNDKQVEQFIRGKVVMVTGGGGSIGSELCRQIVGFHPSSLVIVDIYENNAYDIEQELRFLYGDKLNLSIEIASVRDEEKVNQLFQKYRPNIVFHAAAHKHVPLMENCPDEAIKNNIYGTYHVVLAADRYHTEKFVLISTDKAVNPTNIMGATKRFCEMIVQSMNRISKTEYVAVRFGNVLGSNGSVIPLFKRQIEKGGPLTITDKRIIRFFMTIPEAAQLVLQAGSIASSSEIFVLDMGQPVKILDLAEKLIRLSGYEPYTEIPIIETGLRPGEKLYEELLMRGEELISTSNKKIFIERQKELSPVELHDKLGVLQRALEVGSISALKRAMKLVIPTYHDPEEVNRKSVSLDYQDVILKENIKIENVG